MNLIIDVGNTNVKLAVFSANRLIRKRTTVHKNLRSTALELLKKHASIDRVILASVGPIKKNQFNYLPKDISCTVLDSKTKLPFKNLYRSPKTLGVDRLALVSASVKHFPTKNALVIDAGTCVTYDFINAKNEYLGGAISPGIRLRYRSLNNLTANLPLLDTKVPRNVIGKSTSASIHSGVINGILKEIDGLIDEYQKKYKDLTVILTGGDAKLLSKRLKNSIFANSNFLLEGLNYILEFNRKT